MALLVVLWTLSLMALLAVAFGQNAWLERHRVRNLVDAAAAKASLHAGLSIGIAALLQASSSRSWARDGTSYHLRFAMSDLTITLQDSNGCLNINGAPLADIRALIMAIGTDKGVAQSLAAAIVDWRDEDQLLTPGGAEANTYADAGLAERPANRPFLSTEELRGVFGMTAVMADRLLPMVSIASTANEINRSTAPEPVLRADASIPPEEVTAIMARRAARAELTPFGEVFEPGLGTVDAQSRSATQADLAETAEGPVFSISIDVVTAAGARARGRGEIWLTGDLNQPYHVLEWHLGPSSATALAATP